MQRIVVAGLGALAVVAAALGVVYLVVACQSLPSVLGGIPGDSHPRTRLGLAVLGLAVVFAAAAAIARLRRSGGSATA